MTQPAYPAAREAAARVRPHFAQDRNENGGKSATIPDLATIEAIIDVAFWASLRREEIYTPRVSLAFVAPEHVSRPLILERPVPLAPQALTRIGPAVERPGIHLGVWPVNDTLQVWGATRTLPASCFVLEILAPGLLVIKHSRGDKSGKFVNVAVLQGDEIKVLDQHAATTPDCPGLVTSLLGLESQFAASGSANVLIQLAVSMRAHARGGALLVVPSDILHPWRESILHPVTYSVAPAFSALADLVRTDVARPNGSRPRRWEEALQRVVDGVAGLTAVDGATVINDRYEVLAFGAKIIRRRDFERVHHVVVTEPVEGAVPMNAEPAQFGGTRHLSAAQFAHDQRDAIALVASQDGRFTVFAWSPCEENVHAHRIETLLL
jgi:hypothetical protein